MNGKQRLGVLANDLENQGESPLNMISWFNLCGTASCAGGRACELKELIAEGLKSEAGIVRKRLTPSYNGFIGLEALIDFFELSSEEATAIFTEDAYDTPEAVPAIEVASRIRAVIAGQAFRAPDE